MAKFSLWKAILALGYVQIVFGNPETTIEVTSSNACEICVCSPGPTLQPKEIVKCKNSKSLIKVFSLPNFVRGIEIINIEFGVVFMRGAIRVRNNFDVLVEKVKSVDFQEKSTKQTCFGHLRSQITYGKAAGRNETIVGTIVGTRQFVKMVRFLYILCL